MKGLVIPESETSSSVASPTPASKTLSTPPWKQSAESNNFPKYSPAFKRKPFSVFGQTTPATTEQQNGGSKNSPNENTQQQKQNTTTNHVVPKSDDSDNDSAVSSGRSSLSHSSVSPP